MFEDISNKPRIDPDTEATLERYNFYYINQWKLSDLPYQACGDKNYIADNTILYHYRNLNYQLIGFENYNRDAVGGMVNYGCWLVTDIDQKGMSSPMNMYETHIHPGKKRYMVANYLQLDSVPVLLQTQKTLNLPRVRSLSDLSEVYKHNYSTKVVKKESDWILECSWHGATNSRDNKGYDNWWKISSEELEYKNTIKEYITQNGLAVNTPATSDNSSLFEIIVYDKDLLTQDMWKLYFHFDPRVYKKICETGKIEIINRITKNRNILRDCKLVRTLNRSKF